ncbi:I78 family peptidase inhibitor [Cypionkella aquatica]|nr:I78 family peptidase inhibitor [Cypionkella aquatica]
MPISFIPVLKPVSRFLLVLPLALMACMPEEPATPSAEAACGADQLQTLVGQSAKVLETMRFGQTVRIIRPGMAVTMDYAAERLNINIDAAEVITRVNCG